MSSEWWHKKPRSVNIIVDNESWVLPYAEELVNQVSLMGDAPQLIRDYAAIQESDISFYLGCVKITPPHILSKCKKNLVVHASALPRGKGFSPLTWQILEGKNDIPICLLEMAEEVDAGDIIFEESMHFLGDELIDELRQVLGKKTIELCCRYLQMCEIPKGKIQEGDSTFYPRRGPADSRLSLSSTIEELFNLLRVVDNERYPAFFERHGEKYILKIYKNSSDK